MAVTLSTAARNAAADATVDLLDAGAGPGTLVFLTSADAEVATLTFSDPAFGAAASGVATANSITPDTNATGGSITKAELRDSNAVVVFTMSVTATGGGGDITLSSLNIGAGDTVSVTSLTVTQPAT